MPPLPTPKTLRSIAAAAGIFAVLGAGAAHATLVTVDFAATLVPNTASTAAGFTSGDSITGSFTYDTAAAQYFSVSGEADYVLAGATVTDITQGNTATNFPGNGGFPDEISILHNAGAGDAFYVTAWTSDGTTRLQVSGTASFGSVFTDTSLPSTLTLSSFSPNGDIYAGEGADLTMSFAAPEPASLALLAFGVASLGMARRRRRSPL